jgi:hypothetical protein
MPLSINRVRSIDSTVAMRSPSGVPPLRMVVVLSDGRKGLSDTDMWYRGRVLGAFAGGRRSIASRSSNENVYLTGSVGTYGCE